MCQQVDISIKGKNYFLIYIIERSLTEQSTYIYSLKLKFSNGKIAEVCPTAFARAHCRGHTFYDRCVAELKNGAVSGGSSMFKNHCNLKPSAVKHLQKTGGHFKMNLSNKEFTVATLPNTLNALHTAIWMDEFFRLTGIHRSTDQNC